MHWFLRAVLTVVRREELLAVMGEWLEWVKHVLTVGSV